MLTASLRSDIHDRTFQNLEQRLLNTLARHVARNARVVALARDLIYLVDKDDTSLGSLDIVVGNLQQTREDTLNILAHIARLGEHRRINNRERHIEQLCNGARDERLTRTRRTYKQDVRLVDLDICHLLLRRKTLIVVVDRHCDSSLSRVLTDDILVEVTLDIHRLRHLREIITKSLLLRLRLTLLRGYEIVVRQGVIAHLYTLTADVHPRLQALKQNICLATLATAERAAINAVRTTATVSLLRHTPTYAWLTRCQSGHNRQPRQPRANSRGRHHARSPRSSCPSGARGCHRAHASHAKSREP